MKKGVKHIPKKDTKQVVQKKSERRLIYAIIFGLAFLLYGYTITFDYALDDLIVITKNEFTVKGFDGIKDILTTDLFKGYYGNQDLVQGGRYRPLSLVTFAIEYELFGANPHVSHFINVLLYAIACVLIFIILNKLFIKHNVKKWYLSVPFVAVILYIAHPIHTEVVANIKGRDEIMSLIGSLLTLWFVLNFLDTRKIKYWMYSLIAFFLALLSKENSITFLVVIPLTVYFFTKHPIKRNLISLIPLIIVTLLFLDIRYTFVGNSSKEITDLMNDPFLYATFAQRYATVFYTLGIYVKLLFFPHPLTYDYYPYHIPLINWTDWRAIVPLLIYIALGVYAIIGLKKKNIISYGIWFYLITFSIASNLFFSIGAFMNERFVFISSLGFCLIIAYLLTDKASRYINITPVAALLVVVLMLYSFKTIDRSKAWKDDFSLITTDVKTSFNSAKSNTSAGYMYMEKGDAEKDEAKRKEYFQLSIQYLHKSIEIYPGFVNALINLGATHYKYNKDYKKTIYYYTRVLKLSPNYNAIFESISKVLKRVDGMIDYKIQVYEELNTINPDRYEVNYNLGVLYGKYKGDINKSNLYLERAAKIGNKNVNESVLMY